MTLTPAVLQSGGFASSRKGLTPPLALQIDGTSLSPPPKWSSGSVLPTAIFSPGAPSPSTFPVPPRIVKTKSEERVLNWLGQQEGGTAQAGPTQSSDQLIASKRFGTGRKRVKIGKKAAPSSSGSLASAESDDETVWEDALESPLLGEEDMITKSTCVAATLASPPQVSHEVTHGAATPFTPSSGKRQSVQTFEWTSNGGSNHGHTRQPTTSTIYTSPSSAGHVQQRADLAAHVNARFVESAGLTSPDLVGKSSSDSFRRIRDAKRQSRIVPLAFRRTRMTRMSLPMQLHWHHTPMASLVHSRSYSEELDAVLNEWNDVEEPKILSRSSMTFEWAPRPLILNTVRAVARSGQTRPLMVKTSPGLSRSPSIPRPPADLTPALRSHRANSPLKIVLEQPSRKQTVSRQKSADTLSKLANTLDVMEPVLPVRSPERVQIDVAIQTESPLSSSDPPRLPSSELHTRVTSSEGSAGLSSPSLRSEASHATQTDNVSLFTRFKRNLTNLPVSRPSSGREQASQLTFVPTFHEILPAIAATDDRRSRRGSKHSRRSYSSFGEAFAQMYAQDFLADPPVAPKVPEKTFEDVLRGQGTKRIVARSPTPPERTSSKLSVAPVPSSPIRPSCIGTDVFAELLPMSRAALGKQNSSPAAGADSADLRANVSYGFPEAKDRRKRLFRLARHSCEPIARQVSSPVLKGPGLPAQLSGRATIAAGPDAVAPIAALDLPIFNTLRGNKASAPAHMQDIGKPMDTSSSLSVGRFSTPPIITQRTSSRKDAESITASTTSHRATEVPVICNRSQVEASEIIAELFKGPTPMQNPEPIASMGAFPAQRRREREKAIPPRKVRPPHSDMDHIDILAVPNLPATP